MINVKSGYTFDDLLLIPKYSKITSRSVIDLSTDLGKGIKLKIPIVSANMKNVTGPKMAEVIADLGGLALLHRFEDTRDICNNFESLTNKGSNQRVNYIGCSVGVKVEEYNFVDQI